MTMLALVVTSVIISQAVFSFLPLTSTPTSRQIHTLVAYLVLLGVGTHLGLHWSMIMGLVRRWSGVTGNSKLRTFVLRATAAVIAVYGIHRWDIRPAARAFPFHEGARRLRLVVQRGSWKMASGINGRSAA